MLGSTSRAVYEAVEKAEAKRVKVGYMHARKRASGISRFSSGRMHW